MLNGRGETKYSKRNLPQCHNLHQISCMDSNELIPGLYSGNVAANSLCCGTTSVLEQMWMLFRCRMFVDFLIMISKFVLVLQTEIIVFEWELQYSMNVTNLSTLYGEEKSAMR